jgi:hypothetical protein
VAKVMWQRIFLLLLFTSCLLAVSLHVSDPRYLNHKCVHDEVVSSIPDMNTHVAPQSYDQRPHFETAAAENGERSSNNFEFQPIRIFMDTSMLDSDAEMCASSGQLAAIGSPSGGSTPLCSSSVTTNCYKTCTDADILTASKKSYLKNTLFPAAVSLLEEILSVRRVAGKLVLTATNCGGGAQVVVPASYKSPNGGENMDLVIFATARPTYGGTIAWATYCEVDQNSRPVSGQLNWGPDGIDTDPEALNSQLSVAVHEITHTLGFSSAKYGSFVDNAGSTMAESSVVETVSVTYNGGSRTISRFIHPTILKRAREHFGCETIAGADLEDGGGSGTTGSHWEKRVFNTEYMTGTINTFPVISYMTGAFFEATGYYSVQYSKMSPLNWGRGLGCSFYTGSCGSWTAPGYVCPSSISEASCTFDRMARGTCAIYSYSSIPDHFEYFGTPTVGGSSISDYCPLIQPYSNGECTEPDNNADDRDLYFGEGYGDSGRCFYSSACNPTAVDGQVILCPSSQAPRCYTTECQSASQLRMKVKSTWYECPSGGGDIKINGFEGSVKCPAAADICASQFAMAISSVSPDIGPVEGGQRVTVGGANFPTSSTPTVTVGDVTCRNVKVHSSAELTCITGAKSGVGAGDTLVADVDVTYSAGVYAFMSKIYAYKNGFPSISSVTPSHGPWYGGPTLVVTGTSFVVSSETKAFVGLSQCTDTTVVSSVHVNCTVAVLDSLGGNLSVTVTNPTGESIAFPDGYYADPTYPQITSFYPNGAIKEGGGDIVLYGSNLVEPLNLTLHGLAVTNLVYQSSTEVKGTIPANLAATVTTLGDLVLTDSQGRSVMRKDAFTYDPVWPTFTSSSPAKGPAYGGRSLVLTGALLTNVNAVKILGVAAAAVVVDSATTVTVTTGDMSTALSAVGVSLLNTTLVITDSSNREVVGWRVYEIDGTWPRLQQVFPSMGYAQLPGSGVLLFGSQFPATSLTSLSVSLHGIPCLNLTRRSASELSCRADALSSLASGQSVGNVYLIDGLGRDSNLTAAYTYHFEWPLLQSVTPTVMPAYGGTNMTLTGLLMTGPLHNVTVAGVLSTSLYSPSATKASAVTGRKTLVADKMDVDVLLYDSTLRPALCVFCTALDPLYPELGSVTPSGIIADGAATITIVATSMTTDSVTVSAGGVNCPIIQYLPQSMLVCQPSAPTLAPGGSASADVTVTDSAGRFGTLENAFTFYDKYPLVKSISPTSGKPDAKEAFTLTGINFGEFLAGNITVTFGSLKATEVKEVDATTITGLTPERDGLRFEQAFEVTVTDGSKTTTLSNAFTYEYSADGSRLQVSLLLALLVIVIAVLAW